MEISIIVAKSENEMMGNTKRENGLPWDNIKGDLPRFKQFTSNHPIIMGAKTAQAIGRPLPNRHNIVLSKRGYSADGFYSTTLETVFDDLYDPDFQQSSIDYSIAYIIGGAQIVRQVLDENLADSIEMTLVKRDCPGDVYFPTSSFREEDWREVSREIHPTHDFVRYEKK